MQRAYQGWHTLQGIVGVAIVAILGVGGGGQMLMRYHAACPQWAKKCLWMVWPASGGIYLQIAHGHKKRTSMGTSTWWKTLPWW